MFFNMGIESKSQKAYDKLANTAMFLWYRQHQLVVGLCEHNSIIYPLLIFAVKHYHEPQ